MDKTLNYNLLVSIIVPVFNGERFINETINSVINQGYTKWELIIVDDGSIDQTKNIVYSRLAIDSRIKYFFQKNSGQAAARNTGIEVSKGDFIAFLDADDVWSSDKLESCVHVFIDNPSVDFVYSSFNYMDEKGDLILSKSYEHPRISNFNDMILKCDFIGTLTVVIKSQVVKRFKFDENLHGTEDWDLWIRLSRVSSFYFLPKVLATYRENPLGSSKKLFKHFWNEIKVIFKSRAYIKELPISDKFEIVGFILSRPIFLKLPLLKYLFIFFTKAMFYISKINRR